MNDLMSHILLAIALIFVIEGLIYAVFPKQAQGVMHTASQLMPEKFRYLGAAMVAFGVKGVIVLQKFIF